MAQKARGQLCTGQNQLAGGSQDVGTWTGRALARTAQLWDTQNRFQMKCQCSAKTLCHSSLPVGFWCDLSADIHLLLTKQCGQTEHGQRRGCKQHLRASVQVLFACEIPVFFYPFMLESKNPTLAQRDLKPIGFYCTNQTDTEHSEGHKALGSPRDAGCSIWERAWGSCGAMYCWHVSSWAGFKTLLLELSLSKVLLFMLLVIAIKMGFIVVSSRIFTACPCCDFGVSPQMQQLQHRQRKACPAQPRGELRPSAANSAGARKNAPVPWLWKPRECLWLLPEEG